MHYTSKKRFDVTFNFSKNGQAEKDKTHICTNIHTYGHISGKKKQHTETKHIYIKMSASRAEFVIR